MLVDAADTASSNLTPQLGTQWTTAQHRAASIIEVMRSEAIFRDSCAVLVYGDIHIAKSNSGWRDSLYFHQVEYFFASHAEIYLMAFLFSECRRILSLYATQISEAEQLIIMRPVATSPLQNIGLN